MVERGEGGEVRGQNGCSLILVKNPTIRTALAIGKATTRMAVSTSHMQQACRAYHEGSTSTTGNVGFDRDGILTQFSATTKAIDG